jgi:hypothetical protein
MTRDQLAELERTAREIHQWLDAGNHAHPPLPDIRRLARLAHLARRTLEEADERQRQRSNWRNAVHDIQWWWWLFLIISFVIIFVLIIIMMN